MRFVWVDLGVFVFVGEAVRAGLGEQEVVGMVVDCAWWLLLWRGV